MWGWGRGGEVMDGNDGVWRAVMLDCVLGGCA